MKNSKSGFTLIELLVAITIMGILSVGSYSNFKNIQARSLFQTQLNRIHNNLVQIKNSAFNERVGSPDTEATAPSPTEVIKIEAKYIAEFQFAESTLPDAGDPPLLGDYLSNVKFYYNLDGSSDYNEAESTTLLDIPNIIDNSNNLIIDEYSYFDIATGEFVSVSNEGFKIMFDSETKECDFEAATLANAETNLIKIPIKIRVAENDIRPIRFLYLHKKSCLPEILTEDINV